MAQDNTENIIDSLIDKHPELMDQKINIERAFELLRLCFVEGRKLLVCGNGGSAADAQHIVGELMKSFRIKRPVNNKFLRAVEGAVGFREAGLLENNLEGAIPAISLGSDTALLTAFANDRDSDYVYAQQVYGLGEAGDCFFAISTSGNSCNVVYAAWAAKGKDMRVIALTGAKQSKLSELADVCIQAPAIETYQVQEFHLSVYHALCAAIEADFFRNPSINE